jgi:hypothetical protein
VLHSPGELAFAAPELTTNVPDFTVWGGPPREKTVAEPPLTMTLSPFCNCSPFLPANFCAPRITVTLPETLVKIAEGAAKAVTARVAVSRQGRR